MAWSLEDRSDDIRYGPTLEFKRVVKAAAREVKGKGKVMFTARQQFRRCGRWRHRTGADADAEGVRVVVLLDPDRVGDVGACVCGGDDSDISSGLVFSPSGASSCADHSVIVSSIRP